MKGMLFQLFVLAVLCGWMELLVTAFGLPVWAACCVTVGVVWVCGVCLRE